MSKRLYPHNRVRYWYAYDIDDICALFSDLGLHVQTVRKWIKNGLKTIDGGKPSLIYGNDLIAYLKKNNEGNKCKTAFNEMYCFTCQDARPVFKSQVSLSQEKPFIKAQGVCRECKKPMFKSYKIADYSKLKRTFTLVDVLELYDPAISTDKTHIHAEEQNAVNESLQMDLFQ